MKDSACSGIVSTPVLAVGTHVREEASLVQLPTLVVIAIPPVSDATRVFAAPIPLHLPDAENITGSRQQLAAAAALVSSGETLRGLPPDLGGRVREVGGSEMLKVGGWCVPGRVVRVWLDDGELVLGTGKERRERDAIRVLRAVGERNAVERDWSVSARDRRQGVQLASCWSTFGRPILKRYWGC